MRYAPGSVVSLVSVAKSYDAVIRTKEGEGADFYPVEAFATIADGYDADDQILTHTEAVIRIDLELLTVTDVKDRYGDDSILRYTK